VFDPLRSVAGGNEEPHCKTIAHSAAVRSRAGVFGVIVFVAVVVVFAAAGTNRVEDEPENADFALVKNVQSGAGDSGRRVFRPNEEKHPVYMGSQAAHVVGSHYGRRVEEDIIVLSSDAFEELVDRFPEEEFARIMSDCPAW